MLISIICRLIQIYSIVIFIYVLMSWLPIKRGILADIYNALGKICDPYLNLFRKLIPPIGGIVDITPIIAFVVLQLISWLLLLLF